MYHSRRLLALLCGRGAVPFVAACSILMLGVLFLVEANVQNVGQFKYTVLTSGRVTNAPPAAPDRLQIGDQILFHAMTPATRTQWQFPKAHDVLAIPVLRHGHPAVVNAEAVRFDTTRAGALLRAIGTGVAFVLSMTLATIVFLVRRRGATLAFYVYAMLMLLKSMQSPLDLTPWPYNFAFNEALQIVYPLAQFTIVLFAFRIFNVHGKTAKRILAGCAALGVATMFAWSDVGFVRSFNAFALPGQLRSYENVTDLVFLGAALLGLAYAGWSARVQNHRRVPWIIFGMAIPLLNDFAWAIADFCDAATNGAVPLFSAIANSTDLLQSWVGPVAAIFVCYGLVANRVIDFRYAVEVTAINTVATLVLLSVFTVMGLVLERFIEGSIKVEYVTAVSLVVAALAMKFIHGRTERIAEHLLFRKHHETLRQLQAAADKIYQVTGICDVLSLALEQPLTALNLAYCAYVPIEAGDIAPPTACGSLPQHFNNLVKDAMSRTWMTNGPVPLVHGVPNSGILMRIRTTGIVQGAFVFGPAAYEHALGKEELAKLSLIAERGTHALNEVALLTVQTRLAALEARLAASPTLPAPPRDPAALLAQAASFGT